MDGCRLRCTNVDKFLIHRHIVLLHRVVNKGAMFTKSMYVQRYNCTKMYKMYTDIYRLILLWYKSFRH